MFLKHGLPFLSSLSYFSCFFSFFKMDIIFRAGDVCAFINLGNYSGFEGFGLDLKDLNPPMSTSKNEEEIIIALNFIIDFRLLKYAGFDCIYCNTFKWESNRIMDYVCVDTK